METLQEPQTHRPLQTPTPLINTTFIIPIKVEHPDRYRNAKTVLGYLNHHFDTNVFIYEVVEVNGDHKPGDPVVTKLDFLHELKNLSITHWVTSTLDEPQFHRTKYLNIMLDEVRTQVVCNYDIDVILEKQCYIDCENILNKPVVYGDDGIYHIPAGPVVIYPYKRTLNGAISVKRDFDLKPFIDGGYSTETIKSDKSNFWYGTSDCGHCIFYNTQVYRHFWGENEQYISYGPEDAERKIRFLKLDLYVKWLEPYEVYHFEHHRGKDSSWANPAYKKNEEIHNMIKEMNKDQLVEYYSNLEYWKRYTHIGR